MKRVDFLLGITPVDIVREPFNNHQIRIFLNGKHLGGVVAMRTEVDLTYGYMKAYIKRWRSGRHIDGDNQRHEWGSHEGVMGGENYNVIIDDSGRFEYEELNPNLENDSLVVESIVNRSEFMEFYLRTLIKES